MNSKFSNKEPSVLSSWHLYFHVLILICIKYMFTVTKLFSGRIILNCILKESDMEIVDWIYLTQDREKLWTVVSAVMKLRIP